VPTESELLSTSKVTHSLLLFIYYQIKETKTHFNLFIHSGLKYEYKAVDLFKGEQYHPGWFLFFSLHTLYYYQLHTTLYA